MECIVIVVAGTPGSEEVVTQGVRDVEIGSELTVARGVTKKVARVERIVSDPNGALMALAVAYVKE